jgi:hypothetical protein
MASEEIAAGMVPGKRLDRVCVCVGGDGAAIDAPRGLRLI